MQPHRLCNRGWPPRGAAMYKLSGAVLITGVADVEAVDAEEAERLIRETMARKALVVKQGNTRIETTCGKCGAPNRISAEKGAVRVKFACKNCGHKQETL
jgi:hypothetical protein